MANHEEYLTFRMSQRELFCVPSHTVLEVAVTPDITSVPQTLPCIAGMVKFRDSIIPVVYLDRVISSNNEHSKYPMMLVIVTPGRRIVGALVESVLDIVRISESSKQSPPIFSKHVEFIYDNSPNLILGLSSKVLDFSE